MVLCRAAKVGGIGDSDWKRVERRNDEGFGTTCRFCNALGLRDFTLSRLAGGGAASGRIMVKIVDCGATGLKAKHPPFEGRVF